MMKRIIIQALLITFGVTIWALTYNALSAKRLPLIGDEEDYRVKPITQSIDLKQAIERHDHGLTFFIDTRSKEAYEQGHIPGAISLPAHHIEEYLSEFYIQYTPDMEFITYCDGAECDSSVIVANTLKTMGYEHVLIFFGGWNEWSRAGCPIDGNEE
jgi:rhodanese-related sulfurtransferase